MSIHQQYGLTRVLNARGTFTPLGVSRSSQHVQSAVSEALAAHIIIDELQAAVSNVVARMTGAEAAAVTHCVAAGITLTVAATMTGDDPTSIAALPDASGMPNRVVIPAGHVIDYGHSILTAVRLAGAVPVIAGTDSACSLDIIDHALSAGRTACLLLVSSRLVRGSPIDLAGAIAAAHQRGVPVIMDGAAQDLRMHKLLATGADLVLFSAQKYLASPTAGLIVGRKPLVQACLAQEKGIGRAMKATKEAIAGVLAALEAREGLDMDAWQSEQDRKVRWFVEQASLIPYIQAMALPDPTGLPFSRVSLQIDPTHPLASASALSHALRRGNPSIWVMDHAATESRLMLELLPLSDDEMSEIISRVAELSDSA
jgi:uncharacterized pyridoxal phosphate-dependent enzyme